MQELKNKIPKIEFFEMLNSGGEGEVYRVKNSVGVELAAKLTMKEIIENLESFGIDFYKRNHILEQIDSEFVIKAHEMQVVKYPKDESIECIATLFELVNGVGLDEYINTNNKISKEIAQTIGNGILEGLIAIHNTGIEHGDLSNPENIMIENNSNKPKIIDLSYKDKHLKFSSGAKNALQHEDILHVISHLTTLLEKASFEQSVIHNFIAQSFKKKNAQYVLNEYNNCFSSNSDIELLHKTLCESSFPSSYEYAEALLNDTKSTTKDILELFTEMVLSNEFKEHHLQFINQAIEKSTNDSIVAFLEKLFNILITHHEKKKTIYPSLVLLILGLKEKLLAVYHIQNSARTGFEIFLIDHINDFTNNYKVLMSKNLITPQVCIHLSFIYYPYFTDSNVIKFQNILMNQFRNNNHPFLNYLADNVNYEYLTNVFASFNAENRAEILSLVNRSNQLNKNAWLKIIDKIEEFWKIISMRTFYENHIQNIFILYDTRARNLHSKLSQCNFIEIARDSIPVLENFGYHSVVPRMEKYATSENYRLEFIYELYKLLDTCITHDKSDLHRKPCSFIKYINNQIAFTLNDSQDVLRLKIIFDHQNKINNFYINKCAKK